MFWESGEPEKWGNLQNIQKQSLKGMFAWIISQEARDRNQTIGIVYFFNAKEVPTIKAENTF